jgi:hypothetical protein
LRRAALPNRSKFQPPAPTQLATQLLILWSGEIRVTLHQRKCFLACLLRDTAVPEDVGYLQFRKPRLPGAEEVAGAADLEVGLCYYEAVGTLGHHLQTLGAVL